jgi:hypothetical protein
MGQARFIALAVTLALGVLASAGPARAQYGAIAYDQNNCAWGDSWNYANPALASANALSSCKAAGCKVLAQIGPAQCGALAATGNCRGWGWATRPTRAESELAAMQECQKYNAGQCTLKLSDCDNR